MIGLSFQWLLKRREILQEAQTNSELLNISYSQGQGQSHW